MKKENVDYVGGVEKKNGDLNNNQIYLTCYKKNINNDIL
jgi:hypothetical protein